MPFAEDQFRQFIALYPKDPQAADATNWLGEALLQRQAYDDAADVLLTGFQNYQKSPRAPDLLLKLGIALAGAGEQDTACRTFFEVAKRYPKQPAAFMQRLKDEKGEGASARPERHRSRRAVRAGRRREDAWRSRSAAGRTRWR